MRFTGALVLTLGLAVVSLADDAKTELDRLQGTWKLARMEMAGQVAPEKAVPTKEFTLKGNQLTPNDAPDDPAKLTLNAEKKPAWIDFVDRDKKTMRGIYRVTGDRWEICVSKGDKRPTDFKTTAQNQNYLMVLERKK